MMDIATKTGEVFHTIYDDKYNFSVHMDEAEMWGKQLTQ